MAPSPPALTEHGSHRVADPGDPPRELSGLGWGAAVSLGILGFLDLVRAFSTLGLRSAVVNEGDVSGTYRALSIWVELSTLAVVVSAAVFIAWFYGAYRNLRRLGVQDTRFGTGWAIGAWFVPILGLVRPKQIANEIWRGSEPGVEVSRQWRRVAIPRLVHWWWGLFIAQGLLIGVGLRLSATGYANLTSLGEGSPGTGLSQMRTGTTVEILGLLLGVLGAALAIAMVSRTTRRLDLAREAALSVDPVGEAHGLVS